MVRIERGLLTGNHDCDFCVVVIAYVVVEVDHAIFVPRFQIRYIDSLKFLGGILQVSNERLARHDEDRKREYCLCNVCSWGSWKNWKMVLRKLSDGEE